MALTLTLEPALVLLGQLDDLRGSVLERAQARERLQIVSEAQQGFQPLEPARRSSSSTGARSRRALARPTTFSSAAPRRASLLVFSAWVRFPANAEKIKAIPDWSKALRPEFMKRAGG
jgi:hypothetical protein